MRLYLFFCHPACLSEARLPVEQHGRERRPEVQKQPAIANVYQSNNSGCMIAITQTLAPVGV